MPTVFESMSECFYAAFFEPDLDKRKGKLDAWMLETIPVIQSAVKGELQTYFEEILKDTWTIKGWKTRAQKFIEPSFMDKYKLELEIKISQSKPSARVVGSLTPEIREKTNNAIKAAQFALAKLEPPPPIALKEIDIHGKYVNEAIPIVDNFLSDCYRDNIRRIRIIHGKGIFILQKAIREYLGKNEFISSGSISPADKDHGGEGATEANLIEFTVEKLR
jgi:DNA-nicking Smr family endonuclease